MQTYFITDYDKVALKYPAGKGLHIYGYINRSMFMCLTQANRQKNKQHVKYLLLVGHESLKLRRALSLVLRVDEDEVDIGRKLVSSSEGRSVMVRDILPPTFGG